MTGQRRLFMTHAGELAHLLARAVGPGAMAAQFIHSYAGRHNRRALLGNPQQIREMESTIGREALLVMAFEVRRRVPRAFASGSRGVPRPDEAAVAEVFASEFLASLGRILSGPSQEPAAFDRDLKLYDRWTTRRETRAVAASVSVTAESPFPDRCAMLLDPSMMEAARREAADFEIELLRETAKIFEQLGRHGLRRSSSTPHRPSRPARRAGKAARPVVKRKRFPKRLVSRAKVVKSAAKHAKQSPLPPANFPRAEKRSAKRSAAGVNRIVSLAAVRRAERAPFCYPPAGCCLSFISCFSSNWCWPSPAFARAFAGCKPRGGGRRRRRVSTCPASPCCVR